MKKFKQLFIGVGIAAGIGLLFRIFFDVAWGATFFSVMAIGFLVGVPLLMGFVTIYIIEKERTYSATASYIIPWITVFVLFIVTICINIEGWACWLMALPLFMIFSGFGGLWAHKVRAREKQKKNKLQLSIAFLLPLIITPIEHMIGASSKQFKAYTEINIHASKDQIWKNVTRVRAIDQSQDSASFTRFLGFPRPIEAELDKESVGGKRKAIFENGLIFNEEVIAYKPQKSMTFTIHANPYDIPSTTMDKHIVVGGEFFDVLNGTYQLDQVNKSTYKLRLFSNFKLHTTFNFYAGIWANWIMKDIQQNILKVIKARAENTNTK